MANDTQETLFKIFAGLAGGAVIGTSASGGGPEGGPTTGTTASTGGLASAAIGSAILAATGDHQQKDGGGAAAIALNVVKSGLGTVPLVAALLGLFGGGGNDDKPAPLVKYALPE